MHCDTIVFLHMFVADKALLDLCCIVVIINRKQIFYVCMNYESNDIVIFWLTVCSFYLEVKMGLHVYQAFFFFFFF